MVANLEPDGRCSPFRFCDFDASVDGDLVILSFGSGVTELCGCPRFRMSDIRASEILDGCFVLYVDTRGQDLLLVKSKSVRRDAHEDPFTFIRRGLISSGGRQG